MASPSPPTSPSTSASATSSPATMPAHIKQTIKQAKAAYKKKGDKPTEEERARLIREAERYERADQLREKEKQKKINKQKRLDKQRREDEARRKQGISLATQLAGYSHTQKQLRGAMEAFVGFGKKKPGANADTPQKASAAAQPLVLAPPTSTPWKSSPVEPSEAQGGEDQPDPVAPIGDAGPSNAGAETPKNNNAPAPLEHGGSEQSCEDTTDSNSEPWDLDGLDDNELLDAIKGKTPKSQASLQVSKGLSACAEDIDSKNLPACSPSIRYKCSGREIANLEVIDGDDWDDMFASNSQLERELASPAQVTPKTAKSDIDWPSSDFDITSEDLEEINGPLKTPEPQHDELKKPAKPSPTNIQPAKHSRASMPPPPKPLPAIKDMAIHTNATATPKRKHDSFEDTLPTAQASPLQPRKKARVAKNAQPPRKPVTPVKQTSATSTSDASRYASYGLSTQILQDALDDEDVLSP